MKINKEELWSIPNLMGYFRVLLIPVFCYYYLTATDDSGYYKAAFVVLLSTVTDFLDGFVARRFNMITEWGKFVDPVADKLTHFSLVCCLTTRYSLMWAAVILMIFKEGFMAVMGVIKLKDGKKLDGAKWFGKVCTGVLFGTILILVLFPAIPQIAAQILIGLCLIMMSFTLVNYALEFHKM